MYIVRNLTNQTIVLSDLRAEIGPYKMLDLEKVALREAIDRSGDLKFALSTAKLRLLNSGIIRENGLTSTQERVIEKHHYIEREKTDLTEAKMMAMMRKLIQEQKNTSNSNNVDQQVLDAVTALKNQISSLNISGETTTKGGIEMPSIDPVKLAELQSKAITKVSENLKTGNVKNKRKVILKNTKLDDLANELY